MDARKNLKESNGFISFFLNKAAWFTLCGFSLFIQFHYYLTPQKESLPSARIIYFNIFGSKIGLGGDVTSFVRYVHRY